MDDLELILSKGKLFKIISVSYVYPNGSGVPNEEVSMITDIYNSEEEIKNSEMLKRYIYTREEILALIRNGTKLEISERLINRFKSKEESNPDPLMKLMEDGAFSMEEASFMYNCFKKQQNRDTFTFERDSCRITIKLFKDEDK